MKIKTTISRNMFKEVLRWCTLIWNIPIIWIVTAISNHQARPHAMDELCRLGVGRCELFIIVFIWGPHWRNEVDLSCLAGVWNHIVCCIILDSSQRNDRSLRPNIPRGETTAATHLLAGILDGTVHCPPWPGISTHFIFELITGATQVVLTKHLLT